ncbi:hypothetical protein BVC80_753g6 [Macleaya cordata]|uniref:Leucine-rich repeat n=1 Tax=Macleaya cordata TaxID=56857 RepID=A0A200QS13_MACCD|nr:hypothetical protein BVC80_753g6 [Macleaya cordata]
MCVRDLVPLRLVTCYDVSNDALIETAKKLPLLEELELCHCEFATEVLEVVGHLCPQLKLFRLNYRTYWCSHFEGDDKTLAIATSMTQLRHLHLFGNMLTDTGLRAILDGCAYLESLDLRRCFNLNLEGDLLKRCVDGIRNLRLPEDSTDDYEFGTDGDNNESDGDTDAYEFGVQRDEDDFYLDRDEYYEIYGEREDEYESDRDDYGFYADWRYGYF